MISDDIVGDISIAVQDIMRKANIKDYKYEIEGKSESGDNYMGEVIFFSVVPEENEKKTYHYVMKTSKRSQELRDAMPIEVFYNRELYMYSHVFPAYRNLIKEVCPDFEFDMVPKVFYFNETHGKESIVMENLKNEGYKLRDRKKPWNMEHSLFAMQHYGKLHALSIALKEHKPEVFKQLEKKMGNVTKAWQETVDYKKFLEKPLEHIMDLLRKIGRDDLVAKYDGLVDEAITEIYQHNSGGGEATVISHMDCWNNNFMFKYENEDETKPSSIRFLDFQLSVIDSPAKDLSYNIYATCDNSCLSKFDILLKTYHESLTHCLKRLGCQLPKCFSLEELKGQWRRYGLYGLFFSITIIKIELLEKENAPKIEDMSKTEDGIMDVFDVKVTDQEEYDRRILEVFLHFGDKFL